MIGGGASGGIKPAALALAAGIALLSPYAMAGELPDPTLTPGAINPAVTQDTIASTICVPGWTKTIRPPVSYTNKLKLAQMKAMGLTGKPSDFEEDHAISLEIGGDPRSPLNLWPQKWAGPWGAHQKDAIETKMKRLVCAGTISLADAQHAIATDWIAAYRIYVTPLPALVSGK